jgi:hypothetical protein
MRFNVDCKEAVSNFLYKKESKCVFGANVFKCVWCFRDLMGLKEPSIRIATQFNIASMPLYQEELN